MIIYFGIVNLMYFAIISLDCFPSAKLRTGCLPLNGAKSRVARKQANEGSLSFLMS
jgi:hypothetical protein